MQYSIAPTQGRRQEACTALTSSGMKIVADKGAEIIVSAEVSKAQTLDRLFNEGLIENYTSNEKEGL